jgi:hypothetical protein
MAYAYGSEQASEQGAQEQDLTASVDQAENQLEAAADQAGVPQEQVDAASEALELAVAGGVDPQEAAELAELCDAAAAGDLSPQELGELAVQEQFFPALFPIVKTIAGGLLKTAAGRIAARRIGGVLRKVVPKGIPLPFSTPSIPRPSAPATTAPRPQFTGGIAGGLLQRRLRAGTYRITPAGTGNIYRITPTMARK